MANYFAELASIDVGKHIEKKGKFSYLSWTYAVDTLRKHDSEAFWEVKRFGSNQDPYMKTDCGYFVEVAVTCNGTTLSQIHPVLDNNNRPIAQPNAFQINTSIQRCLVKAIALHGLGLYIYSGEDLPDTDEVVTDTKPTHTKSNAKPNTKANSTNNQADSNAGDSAVDEKEKKRQEALARAKQAREAKSNESESVASSEQSSQTSGEPINEGHIKAINNMLTIVGRKKGDEFDKNEYLGLLLDSIGAEALDTCTANNAKELIALINKDMRG
jgi:hypothetical protein